EVSDPHNLWMKLWINGEVKQSAKTDAMINDIATQVSFLSQVTTLYPGDLITPRKSGLSGIPRKAQARRCFESRDRRHRRHESWRGEGKLRNFSLHAILFSWPHNDFCEGTVYAHS